MLKEIGITIIGVQPGIMVHLAARRWVRMHHLVEWEMSVLSMKKIEITITDKNEAAILDSLNEMLHTEKGLSIYKYKNNYTSCIYLEGDYVKSHEMAIYLRDNAALQHYDLGKNNCVQSVADIILASAEYATETPQSFFEELRVVRKKVNLLDGKTWIPREMHNALRNAIGE